MKKIDKSHGRKATAYKKWLEDLDDTGEAHPKYNSSNGKFYQDIVMDLARAQKGLCAYTETPLGIKPEHYAEDQWVSSEDGLRHSDCYDEHPGQLDHFDSTLKTTRAWSWDNFFLVNSTLNTKNKGTKPVDPILKPDHPDYDPFELMEYNPDTHFFVARTDLDPALEMRINQMIQTLGLNYGFIRYAREEFIDDRLVRIKHNQVDQAQHEDRRFETALTMCLRRLEESEPTVT